ncbi:MAG: HAD family phosphatase [Candidatus Saccharibacteria bacterium]|nr:HAD family phosphatase [Candidatus Saccharibacteria bacterium]
MTTQANRPFAAFDIDGTLFRDGLYREMAWELMRRGVVPDHWVRRIEQTHRDWKQRAHRDAYDAYEWSLVEMFADILPTIPVAVFDEVAKRIAADQQHHVYTYTRAELERLRREGYFLIAISGSHEEVIQPFAKFYGFDAWIGQKYIRRDGAFTGEIVATYTGKDVMLQRLIDQYGLTLQGSYAFGDSYGDRGMLEIVEQPVAFNPTIELLELAMQQSWKIVVERKSIVYELTKGAGDAFVLARAEKI